MNSQNSSRETRLGLALILALAFLTLAIVWLRRRAARRIARSREHLPEGSNK